jgi:hypothetical protein
MLTPDEHAKTIDSIRARNFGPYAAEVHFLLRELNTLAAKVAALEGRAAAHAGELAGAREAVKAELAVLLAKL